MLMAVLCGVVIYSALHFDAFAQYVQTQMAPPPTVPERAGANGKESGDSLNMRFKVRETIPSDYESLEGGEYALALKTQPISRPRPNMMLPPGVMWCVPSWATER